MTGRVARPARVVWPTPPRVAVEGDVVTTAAERSEQQRLAGPLLVIVSGAPGSGKTTLTRSLAPALKLPLLAKDRLQHVLLDALGAPDSDAVRKLGAAAFMQMYFVADRLLDAEVGAILEANYVRGVSEPHLERLVARARTVVVHCQTSPAETLRRYCERYERGEHHPLSRDAEALPRLVAWLEQGLYEPPEIGVPVLRVDTTDGYAPALEQLVSAIRAAWAARARRR